MSLLSNNVQSTAAVTWTTVFTTATTGTISTVTLTFDSNVNISSAALGTLINLGASTLSVSGQVATITVTSPASINNGVQITIPLTGITNPASAGNYGVGIVTNTASGILDQGATLGYLDADGVSTGITANQVTVSATVNPVIEFNIYSDTALTTKTNVCALGTLLTSNSPTCL